MHGTYVNNKTGGNFNSNNAYIYINLEYKTDLKF